MPLTQPAFFGRDPQARSEDDFYTTPAWMTRALLRRLPVENWASRIVEPCVGNGAIVRELPLEHVDVVTNDIASRDGFIPDFLCDATKPETWTAFARTGALGVVITNPPFTDAFAIVQHAFEAAAIGVACLLRITWLEPVEQRGPWLRAHPPDRVIVLPRWSFKGRGNDSATCAWMLWAKQPFFCTPGIEVVTRQEMQRLRKPLVVRASPRHQERPTEHAI